MKYNLSNPNIGQTVDSEGIFLDEERTLKELVSFLDALPEDSQILFFDSFTNPNSIEPGAYVTITRDGNSFYCRMANKYWTDNPPKKESKRKIASIIKRNAKGNFYVELMKKRNT